MKIIDNYLYIHNIDEFVIIPTFPDAVSDSMGSTFAENSPLARSAPIFTYSSSGPRQVGVSLSLHREMMYLLNYGISNFKVDVGDDYVDSLIAKLQACALPEYKTSEKMVNPPIVSMRLGKEVYIHGVITSAINTVYNLPILSNDKYALVNINFTISEIDPYSASDVARLGGYRGVSRSLERNIYKQ